MGRVGWKVMAHDPFRANYNKLRKKMINLARVQLQATLMLFIVIFLLMME